MQSSNNGDSHDGQERNVADLRDEINNIETFLLNWQHQTKAESAHADSNVTSTHNASGLSAFEQLIGMVREFLQHYNMLDTVECLDAELSSRRLLGARATPTGKADSVVQSSSDEVVQHVQFALDTGDRERFLWLWRNNIPESLRMSDPILWSYRFRAELHFATWHQRQSIAEGANKVGAAVVVRAAGEGISSPTQRTTVVQDFDRRQDAMRALKAFDSYLRAGNGSESIASGDGGSGAQAVEHEPFLSKYFALPHVKDATSNPTFTEFFALDAPNAQTQARGNGIDARITTTLNRFPWIRQLRKMTDAVLKNALMQAPTPRLIRVLQAFGSQHSILTKACQTSRARTEAMTHTAAGLIKASTRLAVDLESLHTSSKCPATPEQTAQLAQARECILKSRELVRSTTQELLRDKLQREQAESLVATSLSPVRSNMESFMDLGIRFASVADTIDCALNESELCFPARSLKPAVCLKGLTVLDALWILVARSLPSPERLGLASCSKQEAQHIASEEDKAYSASQHRRYRRSVGRLRQSTAACLASADVLMLGDNSNNNKNNDSNNLRINKPTSIQPKIYLERILHLLSHTTTQHDNSEIDEDKINVNKNEEQQLWAWGMLATLLRLHSTLASWTVGRKYICKSANKVVELLMSALIAASNTHLKQTETCKYHDTICVLTQYAARWAIITLQKLSTGLQVGEPLYSIWRIVAVQVFDMLQQTETRKMFGINDAQYASGMLCNVCAAVSREHLMTVEDDQSNRSIAYGKGYIRSVNNNETAEDWMLTNASKCVSLIESSWEDTNMCKSQQHLTSALFALLSSESCREQAERQEWHVRLGLLLDVQCGGLESDGTNGDSQVDESAAKHGLQCVVDALKGDMALLGAAKAASTIGKQQGGVGGDVFEVKRFDSMVVDADALDDVREREREDVDDLGAEVLGIANALGLKDALPMERGEKYLRAHDLMDPIDAGMQS